MSLVSLANVSVDFPMFRTKESASFLQKMLGGGVSKGGFLALEDINFELKSGDRLGLIGRNGSGKSTLLKVMAGLLPPFKGNVLVEGEVFPALTAAQGLLKDATCAQNIILQGLAYGMKGQELQEYVTKVSNFSGLGDFLNSPYNNLSAGMKGRLSVATLSGVKPQLLFMDEWIGAADKQVLEKNNGLLTELVAKSDIFVIASHRKNIIKDHCNVALVLDKGQQVFFGPVDEAYSAWRALS